LFFRRAADAGLAEGALAMGDTFDPLELSRLKAIGIHPDAAEARRWYEKARELGAGSTADRRLERLGAR
jgi:TPR repeat protein